MTRIEDPTAREIAIRNALTAAAQTPSPQSNLLGWQPIKTAPKDGTQIIGRTTQEQVFACNWFWDDEEETEGDWLEHGTDVVSPREWLAMPAPQTNLLPSIERLSDLIDDAAPGILRPDTRAKIADRLREALSIPAQQSHVGAAEAAELSRINAALDAIRSTCFTMERDDRHLIGHETLAQLRDAAKLINELVFQSANQATPRDSSKSESALHPAMKEAFGAAEGGLTAIHEASGLEGVYCNAFRRGWAAAVSFNGEREAGI